MNEQDKSYLHLFSYEDINKEIKIHDLQQPQQNIIDKIQGVSNIKIKISNSIETIRLKIQKINYFQSADFFYEISYHERKDILCSNSPFQFQIHRNQTAKILTLNDYELNNIIIKYKSYFLEFIINFCKLVGCKKLITKDFFVSDNLTLLPNKNTTLLESLNFKIHSVSDILGVTDNHQNFLIFRENILSSIRSIPTSQEINYLQEYITFYGKLKSKTISKIEIFTFDPKKIHEDEVQMKNLTELNCIFTVLDELHKKYLSSTDKLYKLKNSNEQLLYKTNLTTTTTDKHFFISYIDNGEYKILYDENSTKKLNLCLISGFDPDKISLELFYSLVF